LTSAQDGKSGFFTPEERTVVPFDMMGGPRVGQEVVERCNIEPDGNRTTVAQPVIVLTELPWPINKRNSKNLHFIKIKQMLKV
jgi:hypothetical protein